jgi:hypothetical protein
VYYQTWFNTFLLVSLSAWLFIVGLCLGLSQSASPSIGLSISLQHIWRVHFDINRVFGGSFLYSAIVKMLETAPSQ